MAKSDECPSSYENYIDIVKPSGGKMCDMGLLSEIWSQRDYQMQKLLERICNEYWQKWAGRASKSNALSQL